MGQSSSSLLLSSADLQNTASASRSVLTLMGEGKTAVSQAAMDAPSMGQAGSSSGGKQQTLFERFKSSKTLSKLKGIMGNVNLMGPIHMIDSLITYAIGVVSGMQDMAQVGVKTCERVMTQMRLVTEVGVGVKTCEHVTA